MRVDKFLKVSRIIKRRTVANQVCSQGRVTVNGRVVKPGAEVKPGDKLEIQFGSGIRSYEILDISQHATKGDAGEMYRIL
ncbi:MAG TPA: RNA-binding S4 domain-containing protein [Clostridia bacterium]|nr:RNA-binding S4 domain-containing protein [Clostridia bacterium]